MHAYGECNGHYAGRSVPCSQGLECPGTPVTYDPEGSVRELLVNMVGLKAYFYRNIGPSTLLY